MINSVTVMEGVLPVNKPAGRTSHDIVAAVRRILRMKRIGHTGTLDPAVTGVLPLCLGRATRVAEWLQDMPKEYEAELILGIATNTEDMTGEVIDSVEEVQVSLAQVEAVLHQFLGEIEQVPPMYSAVKVAGRRLYELAREGQEVERKARLVTIHSIELQHASLNTERPAIRFKVRCSKGTYIRTLCTDIGKALGYPAAMSSLIRTESGGITLGHCYTLEQITELNEQGLLQTALIPTDQAIVQFPVSYVTVEDGKRAANGIKLPLQRVHIDSTDVSAEDRNSSRLHRIYAEDGTFIGVFEYNTSTQLLEPIKVFS